MFTRALLSIFTVDLWHAHGLRWVPGRNEETREIAPSPELPSLQAIPQEERKKKKFKMQIP